MQQTVKKAISFEGIGLHSGTEVMLTIMPGQPDTGIIFVRRDVAAPHNVIPARWDNVVETRLCTVIGNDAGVTVGTVEHIMAALRGCGVDNAVIRLDGPEVPIMDGSSTIFVEAIEKTGLSAQKAVRRFVRVLKEITVGEDDKFVRLSPAEECRFSGRIAFNHPAIGTQERHYSLTDGSFHKELSAARTFGFLNEVEALRRHGLALGGSLDNAIVLDDDKVLNHDGLRYKDEFIRHKILDAIGDLYLAGAPIQGAYDCYKPSHALNNALLHKLFSAKENWDLVEISEPQAHSISMTVSSSL